MIDIGANLTHPSFEKDLSEVLVRAWNSGIEAIIITGGTLTESARARELCKYDSKLYYTCGIHPHEAINHKDFDQENFLAMLHNDRCVALGECGLDYHRNYSSPDIQQVLFHQQLSIAKGSSLPLFLHQRNALDDYLAIIKEHTLCNKLVTHCFTEGRETLKKLLDIGSYIGITGWLCDKRRNQELLEAISYIPQDKLLIETDAPFLTPDEVKDIDKRNEPSNLIWIVRKIAALRGITNEELITITTNNSLKLFDKINL
ncbi:MAG: TatD family hydrolase [Methylacidiphilales bacterium]|nr:TatD family hydrolase [Candidatus Methylacidiphilales bacterium]